MIELMFESQTLLDQLNLEQRQAVLHKDGPAIVLAGAGSGKTRVLTSRAAYLIKEKLATAKEILLLTFTNKAAAEMKRRVLNYTGQQLLFSGTFHSLGVKILRLEANKQTQKNSQLQIAGRSISPQFTIYDDQDQINLFKNIYKNNGIDRQEFKITTTKAIISQIKNQLISPSNYMTDANNSFKQTVGKIYKIYEQRLKTEDALDFDDLLILTYQLLKKNQDVRQRYQEQFKHVLIDEYQDTNKVQYLLSKILAKPQNNLFVVGDFSQSIYAWRGADYKNLKQLSSDFPDITEYRLERNYRSTQNILDAATQIIHQNQLHPILELWTDQKNEKDQKIQLYELNNAELEAAKIAQIISEKFLNSLDQIAILYRTNAQSRAFEEAFIHRQLPYRIIGGTKFYQRKEIKDLLAYLRLCFNDLDSPSLTRTIKLGKRRFKDFQKWLRKVEDQILDNPSLALQGILEATHYLDKFNKKDPEDQSRLDNIEELLSVASQFENSQYFLENVALVQDGYLLEQKTGTKSTGISLMSLHSAKGLEFEIVFMVGMEEGLLPHNRSMLSEEDLEEERRLCYVGITRAKQQLFFSYARNRYTFGNQQQNLPSRFLTEVSSNLISVNRHFDETISNRHQSFYGKKANKKSLSKSSKKRRLIIDEDQLDALLKDDIDVKEFLKS
jgi:DNA helicase II / ATP-dependent DNA helicase PcrA